MFRRALVLTLGTLFAAGSVLQAQEAAEPSKAAEETALATAAANPIANLISLPLQLNNDFGLGPHDRTTNVLNVQPVIPLADGRIITRTIFPFAFIPDFSAESGQRTSGLADIVATVFYVPPSDGIMWGVGPVVEIPTGGSKRGSEKWSAGLMDNRWTGLKARTRSPSLKETCRRSTPSGRLRYTTVRRSCSSRTRSTGTCSTRP